MYVELFLDKDIDNAHMKEYVYHVIIGTAVFNIKTKCLDFMILTTLFVVFIFIFLTFTTHVQPLWL